MKKILSVLIATVIIASVFVAMKPKNDKLGKNLINALENTDLGKYTVYVYFRDKGPNAEKMLSNPLSLVTQRSLERRAKVMPQGKLVGMEDVPVYNGYVNEVASKTMKVRVELPWLNAVSVEASRNQIYNIADYDFVSKIELVEKYRKNKECSEEVTSSDNSIPVTPSKYHPLVDSLSYGASLVQNTLIKTNVVHNQGIYGQGTIIAHLDAGYQNFNHPAFITLPMKILKKKDFQTGDTVNMANHSHGQATLSLVGGYAPGSLIGPAFKASFICCRTEVDPTETPIEMDYWIAAAHFVDSLGADIITSSLGYLTFDAPYPGYTWQDMNGHTMPITLGASWALRHGIIVNNAAGNSGTSTHNTLGGPADADSILTVGATSSTGVWASYSSVGPTTDAPARIKPDVMAQGSGNQVATSSGYNTFGSGTSWATPMSAGVSALVLSANKSLTPIQVINIMKKTATNASSPNNTMGWGVLDAQKAVDTARKMDTQAPVILHTQPFTTTTNTGTITMKAIMRDNGIIRYTRSNEAPRLYYRKNSGSGWSAYTGVNQTSVVLDTFYFPIPGSSLNTQVQYYFAAQDIALPNPLISTLPAGGSGINPPGTTAPGTAFAFSVGATYITGNSGNIPAEFRLIGNYPNPFNPVTIIKFSLKEARFVSLKVYDLTGRIVRNIINQYMPAGEFSVNFDGSGLSSGIYFYAIQAGDFRAVKRMTLLK